jgi:hypothetical protein
MARCDSSISEQVQLSIQILANSTETYLSFWNVAESGTGGASHSPSRKLLIQFGFFAAL